MREPKQLPQTPKLNKEKYQMETKQRRISPYTKANVALLTVIGAILAGTGTASAQVNINPNDAGMPGAGVIQGLLNGVAQYGLYAAAGAVIAGGGMWGYANWQERPGSANRGQKVAIGGVLGAIVIGAANVIINTAFTAGAAG